LRGCEKNMAKEGRGKWVGKKGTLPSDKFQQRNGNKEGKKDIVDCREGKFKKPIEKSTTENEWEKTNSKGKAAKKRICKRRRRHKRVGPNKTINMESVTSGEWRNGVGRKNRGTGN